MTPNFKRLYFRACQANFAYIEDPATAKAAFTALGCTFVAQYKNDDHQAVLSTFNGEFDLSISGTRFSDGEIPDIFDDVDTTPHNLGDGALVSAGAWCGMADLWAWVLNQIEPNGIVNVQGHSLGGWRAQYTPEFVPAPRIGTVTAIESPKPGSMGYFARHQEFFDTKVVSIVNHLDLWCGYPFIGPYARPPQKFIWLTEPGKWRPITEAQWPGGRSMADHGISSAVMPALAMLAGTNTA